MYLTISLKVYSFSFSVSFNLFIKLIFAHITKSHHQIKNTFNIFQSAELVFYPINLLYICICIVEFLRHTAQGQTEVYYST